MTKVHKDFSNIPEILTEEYRRKAFECNIESKDYVDNNNLYKTPSVQSELERIYYCKCAYCEKDIKDEDKHIDHYRPKKRYYWLAYSWDNLLFSCGQCNRSKGDRFLTQQCSLFYNDEDFETIHSLGISYDEIEKPMIINPEKDDILGDIVFDSEAKISSQNRRVQHTIDEACKLNRNALVENRIKVFNQFKRRVDKYINNKDISGLKNEIESFIEESDFKSEYYSFRYFILNNIDIFFIHEPVQSLVEKLYQKEK